MPAPVITHTSCILYLRCLGIDRIERLGKNYKERNVKRMPENPPYVNAYGKLGALFAKICEASTPPKFTQDYLETVLDFKSSSDRAFPSFLKRLGFLDSANVPTQDYKDYRDASQSKSVMAKLVKSAYATIFSASEYAYKLDKTELTNTVKRVTGLAEDDQVLEAIVGTFSNLCALADFEATPPRKENKEKEKEVTQGKPSGVNLSYTIVLNLPSTTDIEVFNAIFKSLRENILHE